jgi:hypothetical protein
MTTYVYIHDLQDINIGGHDLQEIKTGDHDLQEIKTGGHDLQDIIMTTYVYLL